MTAGEAAERAQQRAVAGYAPDAVATFTLVEHAIRNCVAAGASWRSLRRASATRHAADRPVRTAVAREAVVRYRRRLTQLSR
jgi:hypothetical protein